MIYRILSITLITFLVACSDNSSRSNTATNILLSVNSSGVQGNAPSSNPSISKDGRYIAYESDADNIVAGDTNQTKDIFVHDQMTGETIRVSIDSSRVQGNAASSNASISEDGRYIAFESDAGNLVQGDTNQIKDIFVHDQITGETIRVSVNNTGIQGNAQSSHPSISDDGRYIAYESYASNLVLGDTNQIKDIFVYDQLTGESSRVSVDSSGNQTESFPNDIVSSYLEGASQKPDISGNGRFVSFQSFARNLVNDDTNRVDDIFVHDRETGETKRVSVDSMGVQAISYTNGLGSGSIGRPLGGGSYNPSINYDGSYITFESTAENLVSDDTNGKFHVDIFVHALLTGVTTRVSIDSLGNQTESYPNNNSIGAGSLSDLHGGSSFDPVISPDGRYIAFSSSARNLITDDTSEEFYLKIFIHDRTTGETSQITANGAGSTVHGLFSGSVHPTISNEGRQVAFSSISDSLVDIDTNGSEDIFLWQRL